jgi:hypothetical protein
MTTATSVRPAYRVPPLAELGDDLGGDGLGAAVRHLAAVYSDHPDYRQEWAP